MGLENMPTPLSPTGPCNCSAGHDFKTFQICNTKRFQIKTGETCIHNDPPLSPQNGLATALLVMISISFPELMKLWKVG